MGCPRNIKCSTIIKTMIYGVVTADRQWKPGNLS